ncbi:hypothetical protein [Halocalculus aciditolerans]|uniref:Uncharacterized protein n=1 Tax=Halocalculus aciditolerans TaxID=1383812 RepID=A0A830FBG6_9EURY|nr:hypothetical protein [Halocalculus aciditolerans]GGL57963.1 hypothetical protein GCM10009039_15200 [Halocalculus aciditolerans]
MMDSKTKKAQAAWAVMLLLLGLVGTLKRPQTSEGGNPEPTPDTDTSTNENADKNDDTTTEETPNPTPDSPGTPSTPPNEEESPTQTPDDSTTADEKEEDDEENAENEQPAYTSLPDNYETGLGGSYYDYTPKVGEDGDDGGSDSDVASGVATAAAAVALPNLWQHVPDDVTDVGTAAGVIATGALTADQARKLLAASRGASGATAVVTDPQTVQDLLNIPDLLKRTADGESELRDNLGDPFQDVVDGLGIPDPSQWPGYSGPGSNLRENPSDVYDNDVIGDSSSDDTSSSSGGSSSSDDDEPAYTSPTDGYGTGLGGGYDYNAETGDVSTPDDSNDSGGGGGGGGGSSSSDEDESTTVDTDDNIPTGYERIGAQLDSTNSYTGGL